MLKNKHDRLKTYLPVSPLPEKYDLPDDQIQVEFSSYDRFKDEFPTALPLLDEALGDVHRMGLVGAPKYRIVAEQREYAQQAGHSDEFGLAKTTNDILQPSFARALLRIPEQTDGHSSLERTRHERIDILFDNEMPPATIAMLDLIYKLTGASIVATGNSYLGGSVYRKACYNNQTFYIHEQKGNTKQRIDSDAHPSSTYFSVIFLSDEMGLSALESLEKPDNERGKRQLKLRGLLQKINKNLRKDN